MRTIHILGFLMLLLGFACSRQTEEPLPKCGVPIADNYLVGELGSECVLVEESQDWLNFPGTVSRFNCGQILKSDFINYDSAITYSILLSIPHSVGQDCEALSPDAIKTGRYTLTRGNLITEPGEAGVSVRSSGKLLASWEQDQEADAFFEIMSVDDIAPKPAWTWGPYYKRVKGKINCKVKELGTDELPVELKNLEFSVYMVY